MVAGICLLSLIGVLLLPILKNNSKFNQVYPYANALLVALGTSALVCSAVFHLLPEVTHMLNINLHMHMYLQLKKLIFICSYMQLVRTR